YPKMGRNTFAYFASSETTKGFDCDREVFIGPYNSEANPAAVRRGKSFNSISSGGNPIGSLWNKISLAPGQEKQVVFVLGVSEDPKESARYIRKYSKYKNAQGQLDKLKRYWNDYLVNYEAATPDREVNLMVNTWNQYQCKTTFNWSRSASYYESGIGRGMGFRDSNQDTLGVIHAIPGKVKMRIKELLANQFKDGSCYHQFFPLTKKGEKGGYSDDPLWLIVSTTAYIKETGDLEFLDENVPYTDSKKGDTVYAHLKNAVDYVYRKQGPHRFPLIGFADWNDCLNLTGKNGQAESVWVAQFLHYACREMIRLADILERPVDVKKYTTIAAKVRKDLNTIGWDGSWYIRAFDDDGNPVGSSKNKEGKIDLLAQAWAVMAGVAPQSRGITCMNMVKKMLDSKHGIMLIAPAYTEYDPKIGAVGTFAPGLKENGGIFCHANPWAVIAETILGRSDRAFDYYKKIAPAHRNKAADIHMTEPYIYSQYIAGPDHRDFGRARNSWLTGSAAWNLVAITNYILGVRADYDGLIVDPCIPKRWKKFTITRIFRNATYRIKVLNPKRIAKGVKEVTVDGRKMKDKIIPSFSDRNVHNVVVVMGK
ncbi:MAG: glycosyl transferase, partial [Candidatus Omnitrophota bacterium]